MSNPDLINEMHNLFMQANWWAHISYDANNENVILINNVTPEDYVNWPWDKAIYLNFRSGDLFIKVNSADYSM